MTLLQLDPFWSVVVKKKDSDEWLKGYAVGLIDYSQEHDLLLIVALHSTGEIWIVPNDEVRFEKNWSLKRRVK